MTLILKGLASQKSYAYKVNKADLNYSLMSFLLLKGHPIANSCSGEGVCHKCVDAQGSRLCQLKLADIFHNRASYIVEMSYL